MATEKFQFFQINAYMQLLNSRWNLCPAELFPGVWIVESAELFPGVWIVESICSELYEWGLKLLDIDTCIFLVRSW